MFEMFQSTQNNRTYLLSNSNNTMKTSHVLTSPMHTRKTTRNSSPALLLLLLPTNGGSGKLNYPQNK